MGNHLFISYSTRDQAYVVRLAEAMCGVGLAPWYFQETERKGEDYVRQLMIAIENAAAMILILSSHSADSTPVLDEVLHAKLVGQRIIVVWLEDASGRVTFQVRSSNWIDVRNGRDPLPNLLAALGRVGPSQLPPLIYLKAEEKFERFVCPDYLSIDIMHRIGGQIIPGQEEFVICTIGAGSGLDIIIHADFLQVSRRHACIKAGINEVGGWRFRLYDTSRNGTWLNNVRVWPDQPKELNDGDLIGLLEDVIQLRFGIRSTTAGQ
jgi:hypothetical protein